MPLAEYESEVFIDVGVWKNYDDLEESLTLDELFMLFQTVMNKRTNSINSSFTGGGVSPASSSSPSGDRFSGEMVDVRKLAEKLSKKDVTDLSSAKDGDIMDYAGGPITVEGATLFGYNKVEGQDSET